MASTVGWLTLPYRIVLYDTTPSPFKSTITALDVRLPGLSAWATVPHRRSAAHLPTFYHGVRDLEARFCARIFRTF